MIMTVMVTADLGQYINSFDCDKTIYTCKTTLTIYWREHKAARKRQDQDLVQD